jgi:hypothetical protein
MNFVQRFFTAIFPKDWTELSFVALALSLPGIAFGQATPASQFTNATEIIETVPKQSIMALRGGGKRAEPATIQVNEFLKQTAVSKGATLHVRVNKIERAPGVGHAWRIEAADETIRVGATSIILKIYAYLPESQTAAVAKLKKGDEVTVTGTMGRADFTSTDKLAFHIDLNQSTLPVPAGKLATPVPAKPGVSIPPVPMKPVVSATPVPAPPVPAPAATPKPAPSSTTGAPGTFPPKYQAMADELTKAMWDWNASGGNHTGVSRFETNGDVMEREGNERNGDWRIADDGTLIYRRGNDNSIVWHLKRIDAEHYEGGGVAGAAKNRTCSLTKKSAR